MFVQNYRFRGRTIDFTPKDVPERIVHELMWWIWMCGHENIRKIEPSTLTWCARTLTAAVDDYRHQHGRAPQSVTDLSSPEVVQERDRAHHEGHQAATQYTYRLAQAPIDGGLHAQHRPCGNHHDQ